MHDTSYEDISEEGWKNKLTPEQYHILRESGTEPAFSGSLLSEKRNGMYCCAACGLPLFAATAKFDSGSGWPSFDDAIPGSVMKRDDSSHGMRRTEAICARCKSHLGHIFDDGPTETGKRYCMNSACLNFNAQ